VQNGEERVIAYASRIFSVPERNYCVTRKELLAVVYFAKQFRSYLLGQEFLIRSDHSALQWLKNTPKSIGQQARWVEQLQEFNFRIEHRPGRTHGNANALPRWPCKQCKREDPFDALLACGQIQFNDIAPEHDWSADAMSEAYLVDDELRNIYSLMFFHKEQTPWDEVCGLSHETKVYWRQWERLRVVD